MTGTVLQPRRTVARRHVSVWASSCVISLDSMRYLLQEDFDEFYEVGPGRVLRGLLRRIDRNIACQSVAV